MLRGDRVVLRSVERDDLRSLWEMANDIEVEARSNNVWPRPSSMAEWENWFDEREKDPPSNRVDFVIEVDGRFIGQCMLHAIEEHHRIAQLGIAIRRDEWGKGFGQDACRTLVKYAFHHVNLRKVCLQVFADDGRAVGAYRAAGFVEEGRLKEHAWFDGRYRDVLAMAVLREDVDGTPPDGQG